VNALLQARSAYSTTTAVRPPRSVEYDVFARITECLRRSSSAERDFRLLVSALAENQKLWTALAVDVADEENALPDALRARILYLAEFTRVHTRKILRGMASPEPLVEINLAVMRGLRGDEVSG
jgi:flagellar protein FlaF